MRAAVTLFLCTVLSAPALAAGPLSVNGAGQPLTWTVAPIPYNPDLGTLGALSNTDAVNFIALRLATWSAVSTASLSFVNAGPLPVDVTAANISSYFGVCGDHLNPIIFDTDGSIIRNLFGIGNENVILGVSGPECVTFTPPAITEAAAILNGRFIDGVSTQLNGEVSISDFAAVFTHELGHYIGLDHSQINLTEAFDGNPANDDAVATMFPVLINGTEQASLHLDDRVSVSMLYPSPGFASSFGAIQGSIFRSDGTSAFQGAYVIARNVNDPRSDAVGVTSGFLFAPAAAGGPPPAALAGYFELDGLTPGASYTVEIAPIAAQFRGGSAIGPLDPPAIVPVPEFWNGADEAATNPPDDPAAATAIAVAAGAPVSGVDIVMNAVSGLLPANDFCDQATVISAVPFTDSEDTTGASESLTDPSVSCVAGGQAWNTVWYVFTPATDGLLTFDTCGSAYDTVVSVFTGSCTSLTPIACNDNVTPTDAACGAAQSRLSIDVAAGQTYRIEVAAVAAPGGGALTVHASLAARDCLNGGCLPGGGGGMRTQCMSEFLVEPPIQIGRRPPRSIVCHDGDGCDFDGDATNHSCTFHIGVCFNNHDPTLRCAPTDVTTVELRSPRVDDLRNEPEDFTNSAALLDSVAAISSNGAVRGICINRPVSPFCTINADCNSPGRNDGRCYRFVRFTPPATTPDRCGLSASLVVPLKLKRTGGFKGTSKRFQIRTRDAARITDGDSVTLRCMPAS